MAKPITGIRIDSTIKEKAQTIFEEEGMSFSTAISIFLHATIKRGSFPIVFENQNVDYIKDYLEPIQNDRFKIDSLPRSSTFLKNRLSKRKAYIYGK